MNKHHNEGYLDGYMCKEANTLAAILTSIGSGVTGVTKSVAEAAANYGIPLAILAPAAAGIGAGALHSKITSPTNIDQETLQQTIEAGELEEFEKQLKKQKEEDLLKEQLRGIEGGKPERSIRL